MSPFQRILAIAGALAFAAPTAVAQTQLWNTLRGNGTIPGSRVLGLALPTRFLAVDASANLFMVAATNTTTSSCSITSKTNGATGAVAWTRSTCTPSTGSSATSIAVDAAGNAITTGSIVTGLNALGRSETDIRTTKYSGTDGATLWERSFNGVGNAERNTDIGWSVLIDASGNAYVVGTTFSGTFHNLKVLKYDGASGNTLWEALVQLDGNYFPAGAGLDPQGNILVGSQIMVDQGDAINLAGTEVVKISGANGAVLWRARGGTELRMESFTVDRFGDAIAGDTIQPAGNRDIRLVKYSGASGAVAWSRDWVGTLDEVPYGVATDAAGNIAVAAFASSAYTVLRYSRDGSLTWQYAFSSGGLNAWAHDVGFDADGNVFATGSAFDPGGENHLHTTKHAGASGTLLWESRIGGGPRNKDDGLAVLPVPGAVYVAAQYNDVPTTDYGIRLVKLASTAASASVNVHGLWWAKPAGSESGWGVNLTQQGEKLFMTWFTYDTDGQGMWLVMSDGVKTGNNSWSGALHRTTGPSFNTFSSSNASQVSYQQVGTATFTFTDDNNGSFTYTVNGVSQTKAITRFIFASPVPTCSVGGSAGSTPNYQDIWWRSPAGSEAGWGVNLAHQGDTLFATWFTYASDSRGLWLVGSNVNKVSERVYSGPLYRTTGPAFSTTPWQSFVNYLPVGSVTFTFNSDGNSGTMDYSVNGITQSKPITRYVFASPPSVCR